jgi:hypothetical protein
MSAKKRGKNFSLKKNRPEILNMSPFGMWVLVNEKEYFIDYSRYPWFKEANMQEIGNVEIIGFNSGLYWPDLDIDVAVEALEHPEQFPLIANIPTKKKKQKAKKQNEAA